jgi:hypothetical protein
MTSLSWLNWSQIVRQIQSGQCFSKTSWGLLILRLEQRILLAALLWPKDAHLQGGIYDQQITHIFRSGPRAISAIKSSAA